MRWEAPELLPLSTDGHEGPGQSQVRSTYRQGLTRTRQGGSDGGASSLSRSNSSF